MSSRSTPTAAAEVLGVEHGRALIDDLDHQLRSLLRRRREISRAVQARRVAEGGTRVQYRRENDIIRAYSSDLGGGGVAIAMAVLEYCRGAGRGQEGVATDPGAAPQA